MANSSSRAHDQRVTRRTQECDDADFAVLHDYPSHTRLSRIAPEVVNITNSSQISAILHALSYERVCGRLGAIDPNLRNGNSDETVALELLPGPRLLVDVDATRYDSIQSWFVELQGPYALIRFCLTQEMRLAHGRFLAPRELECIFRRSFRRVAAPPAAKLYFTRRGAKSIRCEYPIRDVGFRGLQFCLTHDNDFAVGEQLNDVEVTWKHGISIPLLATISHISTSDNPDYVLCGVVISGRDEASRTAWQREISGILHPHTTTAPTVHPEDLWRLYEESGYFALGGRRVEEFLYLKDDFLRASPKLTHAPNISIRVVREYRGRTEATMSMLRCWSHAWLAYQGARRQSENPMALSGNSVLRDMFLHAYESVHLDSLLDWHVTYIRKDARFTRRTNYDFAAAHNDGSRIAIVPFRALQLSSADTSLTAIQPRGSLRVSFATNQDISRLLAALAKRFPLPYLEAYDFLSDRFELRELKNEWSRAGLRREREVLILRHGNQSIAAAIMELVESGVHLVGLANSVRLVELAPGAETRFGDLLRAVRRFYRAQGCGQFVLFDECLRTRRVLEAEDRDLGEADQVFMSKSLVPEFLENIYTLTSPSAKAPM
jgi:hypothetical protein